jgi:hypothetical protein
MNDKISPVFYIFILDVFLLIFLSPYICFSGTESNKTWEFYGKSQGGSAYYYSKKNTTTSSDIISVWSYKTVTDEERKEKIESIKKYNSEESTKYQNYAYSISLLEIDCKKKLNRAKEIIFYTKDGEILDHAILNSEWESVLPKSIGEILYQKLCIPEKKPDLMPPKVEAAVKPAKTETTRIAPLKTKDSDKNDLIQYGKFQGSVYSYNKTSIKHKTNNVVQVWRKLTYSNEHKERDIQMLVKSGLYTRQQLERLSYDLTLYEINCENSRSRLISIICYDMNDNVLLQRSNDKAKWEYIAPKSEEYYLRKQVCE